MESNEALKLIREHTLQQCRVIVAKKLPKTTDHRTLYEIIDQINFLLEENGKKTI